MTETIAHREELLNTVPRRVADIPDDLAAHKPAPHRSSEDEQDSLYLGSELSGRYLREALADPGDTALVACVDSVRPARNPVLDVAPLEDDPRPVGPDGL